MTVERTGARRRTLFLVLAAACVAAAVGAFWRRSTAIAVFITADDEAPFPQGAVHLDATAQKNGSRARIDPASCKFAWSATAGSIVGAGVGVDWKAPNGGGEKARVTVEATCNGSVASGGIDFETRKAGSGTAYYYAGAAAGGAPPVPIVAAAPEQKSEGDNPPIIDEITVEKTTVCRGEDNLVTVRAHSPIAADTPWLHTVIDASIGASQPITYLQDDSKAPRAIAVYGKGNRGITYAKVPHVTVLDCDVPRVLQVGYQAMPNAEDTFRFMARVVARTEKAPLAVCGYEWDFGDDATKSTEEAWVEHSYLDRPQLGAYTGYVLSVKATPCDGSTPLRGRTVLSLMNVYATQKEQKHISGLVIIPDPRFPERGGDNVVRQNALVRTWEDYPVRVTKITYRDVFGDTPPTDPVEVSVSSLLGRDVVGRDWIRVPLSYDMNQHPSFTARRYELTGTASDGSMVYGSFTLMAPGTLDRDTSPKITDPEMKDRIMTAMKLLGKQQVTDEDLQQLEREGKLPPMDPNKQRAAVPLPPGAPAEKPPDIPLPPKNDPTKGRR